MKSDPTAIDIDVDPRERRMRGVTMHGNLSFDVPYMSEIVPADSACSSSLWVGGWAVDLVLPSFVDHYVSLYPWGLYEVKHELKSALTFQMLDSGGQSMEDVIDLATWVNSRDGNVFVGCQAGLNRSAVVAACALMLRGFTADEAIDLIREKRSSVCLCNSHFERWLRSI